MDFLKNDYQHKGFKMKQAIKQKLGVSSITEAGLKLSSQCLK